MRYGFICLLPVFLGALASAQPADLTYECELYTVKSSGENRGVRPLEKFTFEHRSDTLLQKRTELVDLSISDSDNDDLMVVMSDMLGRIAPPHESDGIVMSSFPKGVDHFRVMLSANAVSTGADLTCKAKATK